MTVPINAIVFEPPDQIAELFFANYLSFHAFIACVVWKLYWIDIVHIKSQQLQIKNKMYKATLNNCIPYWFQKPYVVI